MNDPDKNIDAVLSTEIKDSFKFTLTDEFDKKVQKEIGKKIIQRKLIRKYLIVVSVLIFLLISMICLFYFNTANKIINIPGIHNLSGIWRYKYISIIILSLSLVFTFDKIYKLKMEILL